MTHKQLDGNTMKTIDIGQLFLWTADHDSTRRKKEWRHILTIVSIIIKSNKINVELHA